MLGRVEQLGRDLVGPDGVGTQVFVHFGHWRHTIPEGVFGLILEFSQGQNTHLAFDAT
jgi:hypothetical protein